ncbi:MAG: ribosome recycling factor [Bacilli bacterium]|nr:ribosome recycling factor [Bacilli bacterium]
MPKQIIKQGEEKMQKTIESLQKEFSTIRTGKANPSILNNVQVEYWGMMTPLIQVGTVSVPDAQTIMIKPYDKSVLKNLEKAILTADLGFNPINDGDVIRIPVPPLTEEVRRNLTKDVKKIAENNKVAIRNIRRDILDQLKKLEKDSLISEDELKRNSDDVQKLTDKYIANIDNLAKEKEQAIMAF